MRKLSSGEDSTLEVWLEWAKLIFGEESPASLYIAGRVANEGPQTEVTTDERSMLFMLQEIDLGIWNGTGTD